MTRFKRRLGPGATDPNDPVARELDEEIQAHLDMRTEALVAQGMTREDARAEALRRFGDAPPTRRRLLSGARRKERHHRVRLAWEALVADAALAVRHARRAPGFSSVAVLIFAAGVGLTTSMFTVADNVLLRPLPFPEPDRLVALWSVTERGNDFPQVSMANWVDWKAAVSLESTALHSVHQASVTTADGALHAPTAEVAGPFFSTVGIRFAEGRGFTEDEAQADAPVVVVSTGFWERVLGAPEDLTDVRFSVDGRSFDVVGVVPSEQAFPAGTDLWTPLTYRAGSGGMRNNINFEAVARLRPGVTLAQARAELDAVAGRIREADPEALYSWGVGVRPLRDVLTLNARSYLILLSIAVGFLLVVACANLAGLSLARARRRARETAVHLALGAERRRLAQRVVTEHVLLALVGGALGVFVAWLTTGAMMGRVAAVIPRANEVGFDGRIAAFGVASALLAGTLAGLIPALRGSRGDLATVMAGSRGQIGGGRGLPGAVMVGTEVALAVTLLVAGGLLLRSFQAVVSRDLGFDPTSVVTADLSLVGSGYDDPDRRARFWESTMEALAGVPGVEAVAAANYIPTGGGGRGFIDLPGREGDNIGAGYRVVSEAYFDALDVPLLAGRPFGPSDIEGSERVVVVNRSMADVYWPGEDPLGMQVKARSMEGSSAPWLTVVGVVDDMRQYGFESDAEPDMFVLDRQVPYFTRAMTLVVEGRPGTPGLADLTRSAVQEADPNVAVETVSLEGRLAASTGERRMVLSGLGLFGGASVLLVCLGIYGLMSFAAGERTREMAVRVALGADRVGLIGMMLWSALRVVAAGAAIGLLGAWMFSRLLAAFLVDVSAADPLTYAAAVAVLTLVAVGAALAPSVRAARQDPLEALRSEA